MKYLMLVCEDPTADPYDPALDRIENWVADLDRRKIRVKGERLRPRDEAVTVRVRDGKTLITDGPFAETKEGLAGYDLLECADLDQAIDAAFGHPMARFGRLELRPLSPLDLGTLVPLAPPPAGTKLFMQIVCDDPTGEPYRASEDTIRDWVNRHRASGVFQEGARLAGVDSATTLRLRGTQRLITDGPFAETKEGLAGYGILACRDRDHAVEVTTSHPMARFGCIEVREFWPFE